MKSFKDKLLMVVLLLTLAAVLALAGCSKTSSKMDIQKPEDMAGKRVGIQVGTTADESAEKYLKSFKFDVVKYDQILQTFTDLKTGRLDVIIVDEVVARYYMAKDPKNVKITGSRLTNEPIGICFMKGNDAFRDKIDDVIVELREEGVLKKISEKWFGSDLTANVEGAAAAKTGKGSVPKDKKVLKVGIDDVYPPMEFKDDKNISVGFDVDMAREIGKKIGMEVEFVSTAWDGIFTSVNTAKFDCIISAVSINKERQNNFALTKPYIANAQVMVVKP
jgi:ABC-type amino acid transport substrate-binding protein